MNGKILYVEDDASKACESFLTGLLSDLIVPELKQEIENKSGSNGIGRRQRSSAALTVAPSKQNKSIGAKELKEIVDKDPELRRMATNFENLTDGEKVAFGQKILDKSGEYTVSGKYQFKDATQWDAENPDAVRTWSGLHDRSNKTLYVDTESQSLSNFMNTLAHEDGHKVDAFSPEMGMLGTDKAKLNDVTYSNQTAGGYQSTMTEQSSYPELRKPLLPLC